MDEFFSEVHVLRVSLDPAQPLSGLKWTALRRLTSWWRWSRRPVGRTAIGSSGEWCIHGIALPEAVRQMGQAFLENGLTSMNE